MAAEKLIGELLIELGLISEEQLGVALNLQKTRRERLGELLYSLRFVSELDILKVLAERFRIHYITSDKLRNIKIPPNVLDLISPEFSERRFVLPLLYDHERQILSILANTPTDKRLIKEVQLLAQAKEVNAYLAMKPVVIAGINKFYRHKQDAFTTIDEAAITQSSMLSFTSSQDRAADLEEMSDHNTTQQMMGEGLRMADEVSSTSLMSDNLFIETLNILISLIEMRRGSFRGHSALNARLVKKVSEKLELRPQDVYLNVIAAYFHDLGKREGMHHTLINLKTEKDLKLAQKYYLAPVRLIETAAFPSVIPEILTHLFERIDGKGFPKGLKGEEIPIGSRIIAVVDGYEDLIRSPEWSDKPIQDVFKELMIYQGTCFDRNVLKALYEVVQEARRGASAVIGDSRHTLMLIDPTGNTFSPLVARFKEAGFRMIVARDTDTAVQSLKQTEIDLILSEVSTAPLNGFQLCKAIKSNASMKSTLFIFLSPREESSKTIQMAFDSGADDFFSRPLRVEVILAKIKRLLESRRDTLTEMQAQTTPSTKASVTGNLEDISIADIVQLLSNGQKTGMLRLQDGSKEAQVFINAGQVINCFYSGKDGQEAFYDLLEWETGEFALETDCTMPEQKIELPTQNLMLEGYRILDEKRAGR